MPDLLPAARWLVRSTAGAGVALLGACAALLSAGCVNPQSDFDAFAARAGQAENRASNQGPVGFDAGEGGPNSCVSFAPNPGLLDGGAFADPSGTYYLSCMVAPANCLTKEAFRFRATIAYTPGSGGGGSLTLSSTPLVVTAKSLDAVHGDPFVAVFNVAPDGTFEGPATSDPTLPGDTNPVSGSDALLKGSGFSGQIVSADRVCARLLGTVVVHAISIDLSTPPAVCIIQRTADGAAIDFLPLSEYHCP